MSELSGAQMQSAAAAAERSIYSNENENVSIRKKCEENLTREIDNAFDK